ncbi:VOC family protein [Emticicia sp. 17c]|uniref:VOC family protein n=1 Tax=Emticicia sp. 17c TaxID=3127704 RepID=UPI00301BA126
MNLNQLTVPVTNIAKSIEFYEQLGLRLIVKDTHYARFECPEGEATFSIHYAEKPLNNEGIWVYFEVADVDDKISELIRKDFIIEELPNDKPWLWREARLKDLDNTQIIVYHAGHNRKNPPWRVS